MRRLWLVLAVLLAPTAAGAHDHFADVCFAFSDVQASALVGPRVTFAKTLPRPPSRDGVVRTLSLIADFGANWGSHDDTDVRHTLFMGGLRYTMAGDSHQQHLPFVEVLLGGVHVENGERRRGRGKRADQGDADPALAIGTGYEYVMSGSPGGWGIRVQGEYVVRPDDITPRLSVGIVKRFKKS